MDNAAKVERQFEAEVAEGLMIKLTLEEAIARFGEHLSLAAIGAIEKRGSTAEVRVIHDASHGILLNHSIRVRDQVRLPTASDNRAVLAEMSEEGGAHFSIGYDIRKAHRRIPVTPTDLGRQACQTTGSAAEQRDRRGTG